MTAKLSASRYVGVAESPQEFGIQDAEMGAETREDTEALWAVKSAFPCPYSGLAYKAEFLYGSFFTERGTIPDQIKETRLRDNCYNIL